VTSAPESADSPPEVANSAAYAASSAPELAGCSLYTPSSAPPTTAYPMQQQLHTGGVPPQVQKPGSAALYQ
jgi:hypothetical protein